MATAAAIAAAIGTTAGTVEVVGTLAAVSIGSQIYSNKIQRDSANKAASLQQHANDIQKAQTEVANARRRREVIAQQRILQAQATNAAGVEGFSGSALSGTLSSISSNANANLSYINSSLVSSQETFNSKQQAQNTLQRGKQRADLALLPSSAINTGLNLYNSIIN